MNATRVGFIGLGHIGEAMAGHLARSGVDLLVYDVRPEPCERLEALGAGVARSSDEVFAGAGAVHIAVLDDAQVTDVVNGAGGRDGSGADGLVVVVHSTIHPRTCRDLAQDLGARRIGFVDAALTTTSIGGQTIPAHAAAASGDLTFFVGGSDSDVAVARPMLELMGCSIFHVGPPGAGEFAKIVNNHLGQLGLIIAREAIELAAAGGIAADALLRMLENLSGNSWALQAFPGMYEMVTTAYTTGTAGAGSVIRKDLMLALDVAADHGLELPVAALGAELAPTLFRPMEA